MLHCAFYRIVAMARIHEDYWCVYWMDTDDMIELQGSALDRTSITST